MIQAIELNNARNGKQSGADVVMLPTQMDAQAQAFSDAATSGARVFLCHVYEQGGRTHLTFSLPFSLLLEMARLNSAHPKNNKSSAEDFINRPLIPQHVDEIVKYLLETENYILPPFIFNSSTPIRVFAFGAGAVKFGYAVIPTNVELYVTDGQHRIEAIKKTIVDRPQLRDDSATVLVIREDDLDQIHQDFADCAKTKPIPPALLAAFDVSDVLAKLTRQLAKELVIFDGRIDKVSKTVGKDPSYLFTMNQLKVCTAEFLFGSSRKQVIESRANQKKGESNLLLAKAKYFYLEFSQNNDAWKPLLKPVSDTTNFDMYTLRQQRIDFNSVGFQIISKIGHLIFFNKDFTREEQIKLIRAVANLDYTRESTLWENNVVLVDDEGNRKIVTQMAALEKAFNIAVKEVEKQTEIKLT